MSQLKTLHFRSPAEARAYAKKLPGLEHTMRERLRRMQLGPVVGIDFARNREELDDPRFQSFPVPLIARGYEIHLVMYGGDRSLLAKHLTSIEEGEGMIIVEPNEEVPSVQGYLRYYRLRGLGDIFESGLDYEDIEEGDVSDLEDLAKMAIFGGVSDNGIVQIDIIDSLVYGDEYERLLASELIKALMEDDTSELIVAYPDPLGDANKASLWYADAWASLLKELNFVNVLDCKGTERLVGYGEYDNWVCTDCMYAWRKDP